MLEPPGHPRRFVFQEHASLSSWPRPSPIDVALRGVCPRCGQGRLFHGLLTVVDRCSVCDLDLRGNDAGDGPAVFVILGLGAIVMGLVFWVEFRFEPPWWLHVLIWLPLTFGGAVWLLRLLKALLIAQQYAHRSTGLEEE
ncbi:MAG: DUF983 domain-containing protein [Enhydrobacter sp.]|nr:DUF983 domain-containing protein [Enhydrobacter sp.]